MNTFLLSPNKSPGSDFSVQIEENHNRHRRSHYTSCPGTFDVTDILDEKCTSQKSCNVSVTNTEMGKDPCPNVKKALRVRYFCLDNSHGQN